MNVILLSLDTLRAQSMSCYGHSNLTTPYLDELADSGTLFETCISPHIPTHPAHTSLFTGKDVLSHQIITQGGKQELAADIPMLAEMLSARGYFTGAADNLGRWFSRGYDMYEGYSWEMTYKGARKAEVVNKTAFNVLDAGRAQDNPFFVFLHYWDPHTPYLPPEPWERMFYAGDECDPSNRSMDDVYACEPFQAYFQNWMFRPDADDPADRSKGSPWTDRNYVNALYDAEIAYMDHSLQQLWTYLQHHDLLEDTLIVVVGDHGEELDEHELWYDHHGLYETNLWVPLIFHHPMAVPEMQRLSGMVTLTDVAPTILDLCGLADVVDESSMDGMSLRSLMDNGSHAGARDAIYLTENAWMRKRGWRTPRWKLIVETGHTPEVYDRSSDELYDLVADPDEQDNLIDSRPDVAVGLRQDMEAHVERRLAETGLPDPTVEQDITLRGIGKLKTAVPKDQVFDDDDDA